MLQYQIIADLDKGLLDAVTGNVEQASQYYRKGEKNINCPERRLALPTL